MAVGDCEGATSGRLRGANFPLRRGPDGPFSPDFRGVIETDDDATVMFECHGYGRAYPGGKDRSSAPSFTSATAIATAGSTMSYAYVQARFEPRPTRRAKARIS